MSKKTVFLILLALIFIVPSVCLGQNFIVKAVNGLRDSLILAGGGLATIGFVVAGFMFLSATGNPSKMTIAKGSLVAAIIGIVIIILARTACGFVSTLFGGIGSCS